MQKTHSIGYLSRVTETKVTTIRYYESIGLIGDPGRSASGQRRYGPDAVKRLAFIRHLRDLGFSVDSVRELINLQMQPEQDCAGVDQLARHQLGGVRRRIDQLIALEAELKRIVSGCDGGTTGTCSVLSALKDHDKCEAAVHGGRAL